MTAPDIRVLAPPSLSPLDLDWQKGVVGAYRPIAFTWLGEKWSLHLAEFAPLSQTGWVAELRIGAARVGLMLDGWESLPAVKGLLGEADLDALPADIQAAILDSALAEILDGLAAKLGVDCVVERVSRSTERSFKRQCGVTARNGSSVWRGTLLLDAAAEGLIADGCRAIPSQPCRSAARLPMVASLSLGEVSITAEEKSSLQTGDLLLLNGPSTLNVGDACRFRVAIQADRVIVEAPFESTHATAAHFESLECRLNPMTLSAEQASSLRAGSELSSSVSANAAAELYIGEKLFAVGESLMWRDTPAFRIHAIKA